MKQDDLSHKPDNIYATQQRALRKFSFNKQVVDVFPDMINRSVPGYTNIINGIGKIAAKHCTNGAIIYDLGCSLGAASLSIAKHNTHKDITIRGIDNSAAMIERCHQHISAFSYGNLIELYEGDLLEAELDQCDMVVINFTLQFLAREHRQFVVDKVFASLKPGGILILSEKVIHNNPSIEQLLVDIHHDFKRENGYSDLEISQKRNALEDVMKLDSIEQHQKRLSTAGFSDNAVWYQHYNFLSLIAIK